MSMRHGASAATRMPRSPDPAPKVLRLAVLAGDVVGDELHQSTPASVTLGSSYGCDVLVSGPTAPVKHRLFELQRGTYVLDVPHGMFGKLRLGGKTVTLGALRRRQGNPEHFRIPLDPSARGKLRLGDATIVFQMAAPKRVPPKPPFPAIFRASVFAMVGGLYLLSQGISAGTLGPLFAYFALVPVPEDRELEIEERFLVVVGSPKLLERDEPEEEEEEVEDKLAQEDETIVEEKQEKPQPKLEEKPKEYSAKAMQAARSVGVARVLGTWGGPGEGTVFDVIASTENNLGELFRQGMTTTVLADGGPIGDFVPGGDGISLRGDAVNTQGFETGDGPALDQKGELSERKVEAKVRGSTSSITGGGDANALRATINHRIRGLKSCYTNVLRVQPGLGTGKHTYTIDINVMGRVTRVAIEEDTLGSAQVAACTKARIQGWRFPMQGAEDGSELTFSVVYSGQ